MATADPAADAVFTDEILPRARGALAALGHTLGYPLDAHGPWVPWTRRNLEGSRMAASILCPYCDLTFTVTWSGRGKPILYGFTVCDDGGV